jgi:hypothetical protein
MSSPRAAWDAINPARNPATKVTQATGLNCYARLWPFMAEVATMPYRHTQPGILILISCLLCGPIGVAALWRSGQWPPAIALTVLLLAVAIVFSSLTVEVSDNELSLALPIRIVSAPPTSP